MMCSWRWPVAQSTRLSTWSSPFSVCTHVRWNHQLPCYGNRIKYSAILFCSLHCTLQSNMTHLCHIGVKRLATVRFSRNIGGYPRCFGQYLGIRCLFQHSEKLHYLSLSYGSTLRSINFIWVLNKIYVIFVISNGVCYLQQISETGFHLDGKMYSYIHI